MTPARGEISTEVDRDIPVQGMTPVDNLDARSQAYVVRVIDIDFTVSPGILYMRLICPAKVRTVTTPLWRELRARNFGTVGRTVHAHLRYGYGDAGDSDTAMNELWLDPPHREREEHNGSPTYIASATETFRFRADSEVVRTDLTRGRMAMMWAGPHHSRLFGAHRRWPFDDIGHGISLGEPTSITSVDHEGRPGWQVTFAAPSHTGGREEVFVLDDVSGLAVRWTDGTDSVAVVSFNLDEVYDDSLFTYDGSWISHEDEMAILAQRNAELQEKIADIPLSRPTWMPSEIKVSASDGDPDTGALEMSVSVSAPYLTLRRWLTALPEPESHSARWMPGHHAVSDGTWTHELRWQTDALTIDSAERILASIESVGGQEDAAETVARITEDARAAQAQLDSPGTVDQSGVIYEGPVNVSYHQYYLASQDDWTGDYWASFAGQRNGLVGTVDPACAVLSCGLHTGDITVAVVIERGRPPVDLEAWEEIVEAPLAVASPLFLNGWGGAAPGVELPLPRGTYRVRYCANRMDAADEADTGSGNDNYRITVWPAALAPDEIIKQTSELARHQHNYAQSQAVTDT